MKEWYESKTVWINGVVLVLSVVLYVLEGAVGGALSLPLPTELLLFLLALVNLVLRFVTGVPIGKREE